MKHLANTATEAADGLAAGVVVIPGALRTARPTYEGRCPFHDGSATLDLLLAELDPRETELFDAALDLRSLAAAGVDAAACAEQLFRVRALLDGRHYLAFYRVRCWARRALQVEVRTARNAPWRTREFPLDAARLDEVVNAARAEAAETAAFAEVRVGFAR